MASIRTPRDHGDVKTLLDEVDRLAGLAGIPAPDLTPAREALARCGRLHRERRRLTEQLEADLSDRLAADKLTLHQAATEAATAAALDSPPLHKAVDEAERRRLGEALTAARRAIAPKAVFRACRAAAEQSVAAVRELRDALGGIHDDEQAVAAGADTAATWADYRTHLARFDAAHDLVQALDLLDWIARPPRDSHPFARRYLRVDLVGEDTFGSGRRWQDGGARVRPLLDEGCDRWQPGLYTAAEIAAEMQRQDDERRAVAEAEQADWRIGA